ncbi:MAG TPA: glucuronate isomerase [Candidatus Angelobacter sp.]|nr:glucuronate isomerase [Candidatus Angelobacter sp.]
MSFIHAEFLLKSQPARDLYHKYAEDQPILDFHTHLSAREIAEDRRFPNLFEIWLAGDHYKWRAMRSNGVPEQYCSGDAPAYEKFLAWAATVPHTVRNPLFHWTHLELKRYFDIDEILDASTAPSIWKRANTQLLEDGSLTAQGILRRFGVQAVCTTDDPSDSLAHHHRLADSGSSNACFSTKVYPTFRPDKALGVCDPEAFNEWVDRLGASANMEISRLHDFLEALRRRHDDFHQLGCRLSDHGLSHCHADFCTQEAAQEIFKKARSGRAASGEEHSKFASFMMVFFGHLDHAKGWTKQLHLGAQRNVNRRALKTLGADAGFDSMGDWPQAATLGAYLDHLEQENALPKMVLYNVNPSDNYTFATLAGSFHDSGQPGKVQFGAAWWFLDQKEGIEHQLNTLSNAGLLSRFVGMVTDSRSFMSYPRHEYFRRVLCNLIGEDIENGLVPGTEKLVGPMIENICFHNARQFLGLELPEPAKTTPGKNLVIHGDPSGNP